MHLMNGIYDAAAEKCVCVVASDNVWSAFCVICAISVFNRHDCKMCALNKTHTKIVRNPFLD